MKEWIESRIDRNGVYTPLQAAQLIGCTREYLYRLLKEGKIESYRIGSRHRIPGQAIINFLLMKREKNEKQE